MKPRHVFVAGASILPASYRQSVQFYDEINWLTGKAWSDRSAISDQGVPMLSAHITSFFNLIRAQLEETSRGVASIHHFHNVQCGIENILCLLEYNNDVVDTVSRTLGLAHSDWRDSTAACISLTKAGRSCAIPSRANERISSQPGLIAHVYGESSSGRVVLMSSGMGASACDLPTFLNWRPSEMKLFDIHARINSNS